MAWDFQNAPRSGAFDNGHLGFGTGDFGDSTRIASRSPFSNSASTLVLAFTSSQNEAVEVMKAGASTT